MGEGVGAINLDGTWIGSLTEIAQDDGYWVKSRLMQPSLFCNLMQIL